MRKIKSSFLVLLTVVSVVLAFSPTVPVLAASTTSNNSSSSNGTPDILVKPVQGPSVSQRLTTRAQESWPWYVTRAAGLVAGFSLIALIVSGVGLITGYTFKVLEPLTAWATHRAIGITFAVSGVIHVVALLFDHYVPFTIAQVLLPFLSKYRPVTIAGHHLGSLYVALGVFAMYCALAMVLTSLLWIDKKPHTWKAFHFLSYLIMIFVFFHALYLGTDLTHGFFRILWIILGIVVAIAIVIRLRRAKAT